MPQKVIYILLILAVMFSCTSENKKIENSLQQKYSNTLNIKNIPKHFEDLHSFAFFDKGAWFGFALPNEESPEFLGGFVGPLLSTQGKWFGKSIYKLDVYENNKKLDFAKCVKHIDYLPGKLEQKYSSNTISVEQNLIFINGNQAIVRQQISNNSNEAKEYRFIWNGSIDTTQKTEIHREANLNRISFKKNNDSIILNFPKEFETNFSFSKSGYSAVTNVFSLQPDESRTDYITIEFFSKFEMKSPSKTQFNFKKLFAENEQRWNRYIVNIFEKIPDNFKTKRNKKIAVKCLLTLTNNWRKPIGNLKYEGMFPSYAISYFNGFWAWDMWKQAVGTSLFDIELAKNQIRSMMYKQDKYGMIPDVVYADSTEDNWRDSKPPLASWAVWEIYKQSQDKEFLKEIFPLLKKYHEWWYKFRDHDQNGLCEFGSVDGTSIAAMWESGMDDAVRFDNIKMLKNNPHAFSMNQESIDLNSFLYLEKVTLAKISCELNNTSLNQKYIDDAKKLKEMINTSFYNNEDGWFYDKNLTTKKLINIKGSEGFAPYFAMVANKNFINRYKAILSDFSQFNTMIPCPTVSADEKEFMTGYWRGPAWLDQVYFAIKGLKNYNESEFANKQIEKLLNNLEGIDNPNSPIRENYNPVNGTGLKVNHFSWSAAHLLLLLCDI